MTDDRLVRELATLSDAAFPETPALLNSVMAELDAAPAPPRRFVAAIAIAAVVIAAVLAFPAPREALARLLGIGGVVIEQVDLPEAVPTDVDLGDRVEIGAVPAIIGFEPRLPDIAGLGEPAVYVRTDIAGGLVSLVYSDAEEGPGLIVTQFRTAREVAVKQIADEVAVRMVDIAEGVPGLWVEGTHTIVFADENGDLVADSARIVANTLVWEEDGATLRIETLLSLEEALDVARSLRSEA